MKFKTGEPMKKLISMLLICLVASCAVFATSFEVKKSAQPSAKAPVTLSSHEQTPVITPVHAVFSDVAVLESRYLDTQPYTQPGALAHRAVIPDVVSIVDAATANPYELLTVPLTLKNVEPGKPKSTGYRGLAINCFARSPTR